METCYVGESFDLSFKCYDRRDRTRAVDRAQYAIRTTDGAVVSAGDMTVDAEDRNRAYFRFDPQAPGMVVISVTWTMGRDRWTERFLLEVRV